MHGTNETTERTPAAARDGRARPRAGAPRLGPGLGAVLVAALLALPASGCKDECSRNSDCDEGYYCVRGSCAPLPDVWTEGGADADADADVDRDRGADADADGDADLGPGADADADADADVLPDEPTGCVAAACEAYCERVGLAPGECVDDVCTCRGGGDAGPDADADGDADGDDDAFTGCTTYACNAYCDTLGLAPGECVDGACYCRGVPDGGPGPDADADGDGDADGDADADDAGPEVPCECTSDDDCVPPDPLCQIGFCAPVGCRCEFFPFAYGTPCPDDVFCNGEEYCDGGACVAAEEPPCVDPDDDPCTTTTCNEAGGTCDTEARPNGTSCEDGFWCTGADACQDGRCRHSFPCPIISDDPCKVASCDETIPACVEEVRPDGDSCFTGNPCTYFARCSGGHCVVEDTACDDLTPCSEDGCALVGGDCVQVAVCP